jgi:hypothetical protein
MKPIFILIVVILLAGILTLAIGLLRFNQKVDQEIRELYSKSGSEKEVLVTAEMVQDLPEPVQRYLKYSGVVGKPFVRNIHLKQVGRIRQNAQQPWMEFVADEYYTVAPPAFIWSAKAKAAGLPIVRVRDKYANGSGNMLVTMGGILNMVDAEGAEIDQGSMMRYFNEMMWFPTAFLGDNVSWKPIDDNSVEVIFTDSGKSINAKMYFDEDGRLVNFIAKRYRDTDMEIWSTPITEYGEFEGLKLPVRGHGVWNLSSGDLTYIELQLTEVEYNISEE